MKSKIRLVTIIGVLFVVAHVLVNAFLLQGDWQFFHAYWIDAVIFILSGLLVFVVSKARKKDHTKTGMTHSIMSMAKLLVIAVIALVLSRQLLDDEKIPFAVHLLAPALVFIVLELVIVKGYISEDEKNIKNPS